MFVKQPLASPGSAKIHYVSKNVGILIFKGYQNFWIGLLVTEILLNVWFLHIVGVTSERVRDQQGYPV